jgi:hypothetical protein
MTPLPMPDHVIKRVINLGKKSRQCRKKNMTLEFLYQRQCVFAWDDVALDIDECLIEPDMSDTSDIVAEIPGIQLDANFEA